MPPCGQCCPWEIPPWGELSSVSRVSHQWPVTLPGLLAGEEINTDNWNNCISKLWGNQRSCPNVVQSCVFTFVVKISITKQQTPFSHSMPKMVMSIIRNQLALYKGENANKIGKSKSEKKKKKHILMYQDLHNKNIRFLGKKNWDYCLQTKDRNW